MAFDTSLAREIWTSKYRYAPGSGKGDASVEDTWDRVAAAIADAERPALKSLWQDRFRAALADFRFLPAGRILSGAGTGRNVTLFNCFVMGRIPDDLRGIFRAVEEAALTMQRGGGVGMDFSTVRPNGFAVKGVGAEASGPLSFMDVWDSMCRTIMSAGQRRGAMMGCLRIDHPDIEQFIEAKRERTRFRNFNLSVLVPDAFMCALEAGEEWQLVFDGKPARSVSARDLWRRLMQATYDAAEPGVIFIDRVNERNNLAWCETITASNPCGEQMLPPYGACLLGSLNLARLVDAPFTPGAAIDEEALAGLARTAVRFLDNVIDISKYPLKAQEKEAKSKRRIGLGVTGLADALIFCGARYGGQWAIELTGQWLSVIKREAYRTSALLAKEKGAFPLYDACILNQPNLVALDAETRRLISRHGLRNGCLTSIAPTGTTSLLAGNISSGIEPVFSCSYTRKVLRADGGTSSESVEDHAYAVWKSMHGERPPAEDIFVTAQDLSPQDHLRMQATAQAFIDSSISKTINCPAEIPFEAFESIYVDAWKVGCKGLTTYRPNAVTGSILSASPSQPVPAKAEPTLAARGEMLQGETYKIRWPHSAHAVYVTVNDAWFDGAQRPFEIFVNSKNMEHYAWTLALTRMISAVFRRGGDVTFVAEELKAVFDPCGGGWINGRFVPSLPAAIGSIIERRLLAGHGAEAVAAPKGEQVTQTHAAPGPVCPRCGAPGLIRKEGCDSCLDCGYSKCS